MAERHATQMWSVCVTGNMYLLSPVPWLGLAHPTKLH